MFHVGNLCRPLFPRASVTFAAAATSRKLSRGLFEIPAVYIYTNVVAQRSWKCISSSRKWGKEKKINNSCLHTSLARTAYREAKEGKKISLVCLFCIELPFEMFFSFFFFD
jgi:hypothetical protein